MGSKRRNHSPEFKTQVALQALIGHKTLADIADIYDVHPVQVCQWKQQLLKRLPELYCKTGAASSQKDIIQSKENLAKLEDINGKLIQDLDWLKKLLQLQSEHLEVCYGARQSTYLITSSM